MTSFRTGTATPAEQAELDRQARWPDRDAYPVQCAEPRREQWQRMDIAARRVLREVGRDAMLAMTDDQLRHAFLSIGNVKARTRHCKTIRDLVIPKETRPCS